MDAFAVHITITEPGPLELAGSTLTHEAFPAADQDPPVHPAGEPVMVTTCDPEVWGGVADEGEIEKLEQVWGAPPNWVTEKVLPAMAAELHLGAVEAFAAHDTVTVPGPLPLAGETVTHRSFPDAVQSPPEHPAGAPVRDTSCEPAAAGVLTQPGEIEKEVHVAD